MLAASPMRSSLISVMTLDASLPFRLGVNVDHVATIRQARATSYPDPLEAALAAERGGARGITIHLREDRRHIQDADVERLRDGISTKLNLEMALADDIVAFACAAAPSDVCIVPERREELTTEGGLSVAGNEARVSQACRRLSDAGVSVSLFVDADASEIRAAAAVGAASVELHTGCYANAADTATRSHELERIVEAVELARSLDLNVNAGHGLNLDNVAAIAAIDDIVEFNIGHSIVARAIMIGIEAATREMLDACLGARGGQAKHG